MELYDIMRRRRSIRKYTGEPVGEENLRKILQAGLLSPKSREEYSWEIIVVRDREKLGQMARCRTGAAMLEKADCALAVAGRPELSDVWVEDAAIAAANMHLMASALGVGSCWIQGRLRESADGRSTEACIRELLGLPQTCRLECILSLGMPGEEKPPHETEGFLEEKIHWEQF